jgi:hypothetical protein
VTSSTLTEDAFRALQRMKLDLYTVGAVASDFGDARDRAALQLILRNAAVGAVRAFSAEGAQRDAAWIHIVLLVDELLRHRIQFPASADTTEFERLQAFVSENADVFQRSHPRFALHSAAV